MAAKWTYRQAWCCLVGSTLTTLILAFGSNALWRSWKAKRLIDERYKIVAIVQTGPEREALKTTYLAELLNLSSDRPTTLYAFDLLEGEKKLAACPLIAEAKLKRITPGTLYIDYTVRKPVAWLADYENTGLDREGYIFPIAPFFSPKHLPEIYLGLPAFGGAEDAQGRKGGQWQTPLQNKHLRSALEILQALEDAPWREGMRCKRIDVSNAFASSSGLREIVLFTEDELTFREEGNEIVCFFPKILRLSPKDYNQQLSNFFNLRKSMLEDYKRQIAKMHCRESPLQFTPRIIDLRIPQLAFVQSD